MSKSQEDLIAFWQAEEQRPFSGWGFAYGTHLDKLLALQARLDGGEQLRFKIGKLMFKAKKGDPWANELT